MVGRPEKYSHEMIIDQSLPLFWEKGMSSLSINMLTDHLGIPKPSLYRHFESEDGLRRAILEAYEQKALKIFYDCFSSDADFATIRDDYINFLIAGMTRYPKGCLMLQTRACASEMGPLTNAVCDAIYGRLNALLATWLDGAEKRGEIMLATQRDTAAFMVLHLASFIRDALAEGLDHDTVRHAATLHMNSIAGILK